MKFGDDARLLHELLAETLHQFGVGFGGDGHVACCILTLTIFLEEKLLYTNSSFEHGLLSQIGDAEATLSKRAHYSVFASL